MCDRQTQSRVALQRSFIDAVALPLFTAAARLMPSLSSLLLQLEENRRALDHLTDTELLAKVRPGPSMLAVFDLTSMKPHIEFRTRATTPPQVDASRSRRAIRTEPAATSSPASARCADAELTRPATVAFEPGGISDGLLSMSDGSERGGGRGDG